MKASEAILAIQEILGIPEKNRAPKVGPRTRAAMDSLAAAAPDSEWPVTAATVKPSGVLTGDGSWHFTATVEDEDIVVRDVTATWFGGSNDPLDNGETASGIKTKGNPGLIGVSLPMDGFKNVHSTQGSPIPRLPWNTKVQVTYKDQSITAPLIDIGPSKSAGDAIDLTQAAFKALGGELRTGVLKGISFRIIGGAKYVL